MITNIITVKYENELNPKIFSGKAYYYYTNKELQVGDIVIVPTKYGTNIARVSEINIDENRIKDIKECMKTITAKIDKEKFLNDVLENVA